MGIDGLVKKIFTNLGENNKAVYAVMAIAIAKGTLRPIFTMRDKEQEPKSKKYTAIREGLTEAIAVPTYYLSGVIASKLAPKFLDEKLVKVGKAEDNTLLKLNDTFRKQFDDILHLKHELKEQAKPSEEIKVAVKNALEKAKFNKQEISLFEDYSTKLKVVGETTSFAGVCLAALIAIPGLCNVILPPVMKQFKKLQDKKNKNEEVQTLTKNELNPVANVTKVNSPKPNETNLLRAYTLPTSNSGMKVGV